MAPTQIMSARRTALLGAGLVAIGPVSMALYTPAMPDLANAFATSDALIKLTLTAYFAGFAAAQLVSGPLTDAFGRKPVTIAFLCLYLVSSVMASFAPDVTSMIIARSIQGVGAAVGISVSRAIVRDQFTGQTSARVMNAIAMMLALGPAVSPTIGGLVLELFGWREIFWCMVIYGTVLMLAVICLQSETNSHTGRHHLAPRRLLGNYLALLRDPRFLQPSLLTGFGLGNLYALATVLPFVLIYKVGLTPFEFGLTMMLQSGSFITGTIVTGRLLKRHDAKKMLPFGMAGLALSSGMMTVLMATQTPTVLTTMAPVMLFAFSLAFVLPAGLTMAMQDFPHIAGAASSMMGFLQFGGGIAGSLIIAAIGDPVVGMATVIPAMPLLGIACYYLFAQKAAHSHSPAE
ncbi:multidrug effflux MFS transporter [Roseibium sp. RKSG952]|uniref:multidrug effflux MFS transporter n=1 Tax=Roseibium sp. RKSG952 TaxID=2529384 RepID=UPI0012BCE6D9|nr:multidrug effflux MFS transporter [Roseibium sp. RKSG952]MTH97847.1 Bcr/CflA family efflux MFS transporter [Roseibium sp. RKSG952]